MIKLTLIRGLPGAGKSSVDLPSGVIYVAADDYFLDDAGEYRFDPSKLAAAHTWCLDLATKGIKGLTSVVVHNTFTQRWEMEPYIQLARKTKARLVVLDLFDAGLTDEELAARNTHGVPVEAIARMRARYEHDWGRGDTRPPWGRE